MELASLVAQAGAKVAFGEKVDVDGATLVPVALALYGVAPAHAAAAVLVYHAIALWVPGLGGLIGYLRVRPRLLKPESVGRTAAHALKGSPAPLRLAKANAELSCCDVR